MNRLLLILTILVHFVGYAQQSVSPLVSVESNSGLVKGVSHETEPFVNGFARVIGNGKYSFESQSGKLISSLWFDDARDFSNGLAAINNNGKWGYLNETGTIQIPAQFEIAFDFKEEFTPVYKNKKWLLINRNGIVSKPLDVDIVFGYHSGLLDVSFKGTRGVLSSKGVFIASPGLKERTASSTQTPSSAVGQCPNNLNFENGNFTEWKCFTGTVDSLGTTNVITVSPSNPISNRHAIITRSATSAIDPYGLFPTNPPDGSNHAIKLGNTRIGGEAERIQYKIRIPTDNNDFSIRYDYAVVFQDPVHSAWTQPRFTAKLFDSTANTYIPCASFEYIATSNLPGFAVSPLSANVMFKPWASAFVSLRGHAGKTIYLEFTTADCVRKGHWGYAYVDVQSDCGSDFEASFQCSANAVTINAPSGFQNVNWWNNDFTNLLGSGQQLGLSPAPVDTTIIYMELLPFDNFGCRDTLPVVINAPFVATISQPQSLEVCSGTTLSSIVFSSSLSNASIQWSNDNTAIGLASGGTGNINEFVPVNNTNAPLIATISVFAINNNCNGPSKTFTITVLPRPQISAYADQSVCNGQLTAPLLFNSLTGAVASATFTWTNDQPSIGLPASGQGNIPPFTATNATAATINASITISMVSNGCQATPRTMVMNIFPTPVANNPVNQLLCNRTQTNTIILSGSLANAHYNWTSDQTSIGIAASGTDSIPSFIAANHSSAAVSSIITITPVANGCSGSAVSFAIQVNITPEMDQPINQTTCSGIALSNIEFTGNQQGIVFDWVNDQPSIGLPATGTGNISSFIPENNNGTDLIATIIVTPVLNGCAGNPKTFTITVRPTPTVIQPLNLFQCNGEINPVRTFNGSIAGATYSWTNNNTSIGLASSGIGNLPSFVTSNTGFNPVTATLTVTPTFNGCSGATKIFYITIDPTPGIVQLPNKTVCNGQIIPATYFAGSVSGSDFSWINNNSSIGLAVSGNDSIPSFVANNNTRFPVTAIIAITATANSCVSGVSIFTITVNPTTQINTPGDIIVCNGSTTLPVQLTGLVSGTNFRWTNDHPEIGLTAVGGGDVPAFTAINNTGAPIIANIAVTGYLNDCGSTISTFRITVNPSPVIQTEYNQNVCLGSSTALLTTGAIEYSWSPAVGLSCANCAEPIATPTDSITYTVTGTSELGCMASNTVSLIVRNPFEMTVSANDTICAGKAITLNAGNAQTYSWSPVTGLNNPNISSPLASPAVTTNYRVIGNDAFNCFSDTSFVTVVVGEQPTVSIGNNYSAISGTPITFSPSFTNGPIVRYTWTPANELSCSDCPAPTTIIKSNIKYTLTVENSFGCIAGDSIVINGICPKANLFVPNAFTPDGDGLNDVLMVRGSGIKVKSFRIFNRWGEVIFQKMNFSANDQSNGWDGKIKGILASPDVYIYIIEATCDNGTLYTYKGNTTILK